jgi:hypothetical protein
MSLDYKMEDKMDPVVEAEQANEELDPSQDPVHLGTKNDVHDMYRLGKEQRFRVSDKRQSKIAETSSKRY